MPKVIDKSDLKQHHEKEHQVSSFAVRVLLHYIHPSAHIRSKYPNRTRQQRLEGCKILRQEEKLINRKRALEVVFKHESFLHVELYCVNRYAKVTQEGDKEYFFDSVNEGGGVAEAAAVEVVNKTPAFVFNNFWADDPQLTNAVDAGVVGIDNNNQPAPENIPGTTNE